MADILRPPPVLFRDRLWPIEAMDGLARAYQRALGEPYLRSSRLTAMVMANDVESVALFFALSAGHAPLVLLSSDTRSWSTQPPLPPGTRLALTSSLAHLAEHGRSMGLDVQVLARESQPRAEAPRGPDSLPFLSCPGIVVFTSGSTGAPRPVYRRTSSLIGASSVLASMLSFPATGGVLAMLPLERSMGLNNGLLLAAVTGRLLGLIERFDHNDVLALWDREDWWYCAGTPAMGDVLSRSGRVLERGAPRVCAFAGRIGLPVATRFEERFGVPMRQMYGTTETLTISLDLAPVGQTSHEAAGHPLCGVSLHVGDEPGVVQDPGEAGRLWVRSPWLMEGYGYPQALSMDDVIDGWWASPDIGRLDEDGRVCVVGRRDDRVRTSTGHIVDPSDTLAVLEALHGVTDAAVVPVATSVGAAFGVVVEAAHGVRPVDVRAHLARQVPGWAQPKVVMVVAALPRLSTGRVDRRACVALLESDRQEASVR